MNDTPNERVTPPPPPSDPMFRTLDKTGPLVKASRKMKTGQSGGWVVPTLLLVAIVGLLGYNFYLHNELNTEQDRIAQLNESIDASETRLDQLEEKLYKTENDLAGEIQKTGRVVSDLQDRQTRDVARIRQDIGHKADRDELASVNIKTDNISNDVGNLKNNIQDVGSSVKTVDTKVGELDKQIKDQAHTIEEQRKLISQNVHNINANRDMLDTTSNSLVNLKTSLDRDYFVFQAHKKSGIIRIKDIAVRLKKTREKSQNYDMEIFFDDKKMNKKKIMVNEPIYFYKMGYRKPYELVINQIANNQVSGYLSIPKVKQ